MGGLEGCICLRLADPGSSAVLDNKPTLCEAQADLFAMPGKLQMGLELLRRHVRPRGVELRGAVETADSRQPRVLDAFGQGLALDGQFGVRIKVRVLHDGLELIAVGVLLLELLQRVDEPLRWWRLD